MNWSIGFRVFAAVATAALLGPALTTTPAVGRAGDTERVSVASNGAGGDGGSFSADISPDGRYVVFVSTSQNLVPGDRGSVDREEVYLHDRVRHTTEQVSPERSGSPAPGFRLRDPVVSSGGRFVAFDTAAYDLPADDDDVESDVFVWDRREGSTTLVSTPPVEGQEQSASRDAAISADGRIVAYTSAIFEETSPEIDRAIYAYDRREQATELVATPEDTAPGHDSISRPAMSSDGRYVAFRTTTAYGVEPGASHVLVHDRSTDQTEVVTELGGAAMYDRPAVSGDGRFVAFASSSDDLAPGDDNGDADVFVRDRRTGATEIVSVGDDGDAADGRSVSPSISADGRHVTFHSTARLSADDGDRLDDVYVYDRDTDRVTLASKDLHIDPRVDRRVDQGSYEASIDDDGRHIVFSSPDRLGNGRDTNHATDAYVHDYLGGPPSTEPPPFPGVPCPDRTSASVTCDTDRRDRLVLRGTGFDERLVGTAGADVLRGGRGSDIVAAHAGPDRLHGGAGRDTLRGGAGSDRLVGGEAGDRLDGRSGRDSFWSGRGADRIDAGGQRRELVDCGPSRDRVWGARGDRVHRDCEDVRRR